MAFFIIASCAPYPHVESTGYPREEGTRRALGRIVSMPTVQIWIGHVTVDAPIYEFALNDSRHGLTGIMTWRSLEQCPYNGRPREQLFRIEYGASADDAIYAAIDGGGLPDHLRTRYFMIRCRLAG